MNSRDLEQFGIFRRYLIERADRSRSRLIRAQIHRWIEWMDASLRRDEGQGEEVSRLKAA